MNLIETIRDRFEYVDGKLIYKNLPPTQRHLLGKEAGNIMSNGYRGINIKGKRYPASHVVWAYHHGRLPKEQIDHMNHTPLDNRIENLRECTSRENMRYRRLQPSNKSGYKGVRWSKDIKSKPWRVTLEYNLKKVHLGCYADIHDAAEAYNRGAIKYFKEFAYLNVIDRAGINKKEDGDG